MEKHQVIIVGAGPAGATCAKVLQDSGIDVLVIDAEKFPRPKTCSGVLFGQTQVLLQKYFGCMPPDSVYCSHRIIYASDIREWSPEGDCRYIWEIAKDGTSFPEEFHNIRRADFDHWLIKQSGAGFRDGCVLKSFQAADDGVRLTVRNGVDESELGCDYLIGADGCNSTLRKALDPAWVTESPTVLIYQTYNYFQDRGTLPEDQWKVFFKPEVGDILCCVHQKDDTLVLCVGGFKGRNLKQSMKTFKEFLSSEFKVVFADQKRDEGCVARMAPPNFGSERVLLTGEAGGFVYLNGEGISTAMDSGYRAAQAVAASLREGGSALERYQANSADILGHMDICMQKLRFLCGPPPA